MDYQRFFSRGAEEVAKALLEMQLRRQNAEGAITGIILETGAYEGGAETPSRAGMKYAPGTLFLMPFRGSHLFNIATGRAGEPSCVEIRRLSTPSGRVNGSGAVTKALGIRPNLDCLLFGDEMHLLGQPNRNSVKKVRSSVDNCLGYFLLK